jgi:hypothetical protein
MHFVGEEILIILYLCHGCAFIHVLGGGFLMIIFHCSTVCISAGIFILLGGRVCNEYITLFISKI